MFGLYYSLRVSCSFAAPVLAHGGGFLFGFFFCSFPHFIHALRISIHALREEGDMEGGETEMSTNIFLSTPSARRATYCD